MFVVALSTAYAAEPLPSKVLERTDEALDAVEATEAQRAEVHRLVQGLIPQVRALREEGRELREEVHAVLVTPEIDRGALEDLRVDTVALFDRGTKLMFGHVADVAELFTPAQRQTLLDLHRQMRERFHGPDAE
jgi:Spy/CpxP family protein refolding chaperone